MVYIPVVIFLPLLCVPFFSLRSESTITNLVYTKIVLYSNVHSLFPHVYLTFISNLVSCFRKVAHSPIVSLTLNFRDLVKFNYVYCSIIYLTLELNVEDEYDVSIRQLRSLFTYWCHVCCLFFGCIY